MKVAKKPRRMVVSAGVRVKIYGVVSDAVDTAIARGLRLAHKHSDAPTDDAVCLSIHETVMSELCELLDFGDG